MRAIAMSDVGIVRDNNEDAFSILEKSQCYVICDGMGGHQAGEVASQLAIEKISAFVEKNTFNSDNFEEKIKEMLTLVNDEIIAYASTNEGCKNMGTTVVMAMICENKMCLANVGDSRGYVIKPDGLTQISKDHSLVAELVKIGSISEAEADQHPDRNIITSALGVDEKFDIYTTVVGLDDVKMVLLCTDGLTNMLNSDEIFEIVNESAFESLASKLVDAANKKGGNDNITVICVEI